MTSTSAISIRGVTKTFGPKLAVADLDLEIPAGRVTGFIGPNGAGKTTTIRMIMSIIFPDRGEISVLGRASAIESKDRIGYLPEERGLYRKMKVGAFLNYVGRLKGLDSGVDRKVRAWLDRVGLKETYRKKCEELSKGMQQKVQFIASVLHEPDLIILDEPFSGLDPVNRRLLRSLIDEQHKAGRTVIFSTHAMFEAEQLCDHLFMIHKGRKVLDLPMPEVWKRYDPRTIVVEGLAPLGPDFAETVRVLPGVIDVVSTPATPHCAEVRLAEGADPQPLMQRLPGIAGLRRVEVKKPALDDIFINIVGEGAPGENGTEALAARAAAIEGGE